MLASISDGVRLVPLLTRLLRHPHPHVRSKAALLLGRGSRNAKPLQAILALGLALPRSQFYTGALLGCLQLKGKEDLWSVVKYSSFAQASPDCAKSPAPFVADSELLRRMISLSGARHAAPAGPLRAVCSLLAGLAAVRAQRVVLMFGDAAHAPGQSRAQWDAVLTEALGVQATIHAIAPPGCPQDTVSMLEELSAGTGGRLILLRAIDHLPASLSAAYVGLRRATR